MKIKFSLIQEKCIDNKLAKVIVTKYHYAKKLSGNTQVSIGYFYKDELISVVTFGIGANRNQIKMFQKIDPNISWKNYFELTRFCIVPKYKVKNLASYIIAKALKYIKTKFPEKFILVSYADTNQTNDMGIRHLGYIYQATNWYYLGLSRRTEHIVVSGKRKHHRNLSGAIKSTKVIKTLPKHKYLYLLCNDKEKRKFLSELTIFPYPKEKLDTGVMRGGE